MFSKNLSKTFLTFKNSNKSNLTYFHRMAINIPLDDPSTRSHGFYLDLSQMISREMAFNGHCFVAFHFYDGSRASAQKLFFFSWTFYHILFSREKFL
jgi:hypothetical protein